MISLALLLALAAGTPAQPVAVQGTVRIGRIQIISQNVFNPAEAAQGWFYRAADALHIPTRDSFIRKVLLFHEGDILDMRKLAETERNLRSFVFIKSASITAGPPHNGIADVYVVTQDAWTTQPGGSFGSKGGVTTYSASFVETDLLGTGRQISFDYEKTPERITRAFQYQDPYLFRPFWTGSLLYADNSDGRQRQVKVFRPFYSFLAPWAGGGALTQLSQKDKIYQDGSVLSEFEQNHRERQISYGAALTASELAATRWTAGLDSYDDQFTALSGDPSPVVPGRREYRYLFATYEAVGNSYVTLNYVNRDSRYEDFNLAPRLYFKAAYSPSWLGAPDNSAYLETEGSGGLALGDNAFAQGDIDLRTRLDGGLQNAIISGFIGYARKFPNWRLPQTFVGRLQFDRGWNMDKDIQFAADGLTGLRGYRLHAMTGDRRVILNVEQRFFSEREILQLISPGAAAFVDAGTAVPHGEGLSWKQVRVDAGVGLRLGIARAGSNNILRFDFAYAFRPDPLGRKGWQVSFSSSQAFDFERTTPTGQ